MAKTRRRKCVCGRNYIKKGRNYCFECESVRDPLSPPSFRDIEKATISKKSKIIQIIFAFRNRTSKQRENAILKEIRSWKDVRSVERVFDKTNIDPNPSPAELYTVYVKTSSRADSTVNKLQSFAEIKYAYLPPGRSSK